MNLTVIGFPYREFQRLGDMPSKFVLGDHLGGFDQAMNNELLTSLNKFADDNGKFYTIITDQIYSQNICKLYPRLRFQFDIEIFSKYQFHQFHDYKRHPELSHSNFLCSFNGSPHVSRKFLVAALNRWGWFNEKTCSKNFSFTVDNLDGHVIDYLSPQQHRLYRKFFIGKHNEDFFSEIYSFGYHAYDHSTNIYNLQHILTSSFLHVVSETMATSYYPFVTEKFLYSIVTRGLFLAYAQPGWHDYLERHFGFRKYSRIFDYRFDNIENPIDRLVELMSIIAKFSVLSSDDWRDLYEMEHDTIEYNYDHYFSKAYLNHVKSAVGT